MTNRGRNGKLCGIEKHIKRNRWKCLLLFALLFSVIIFSSCSSADKKTALKVIIVPKNEIDEITGDFPEEAQNVMNENFKSREESGILLLASICLNGS